MNIARINKQIVKDLLESFPHMKPWNHFQASDVIRDVDLMQATWRPLSALKEVGGVYAIFLPVASFSKVHTIQLHAAKKKDSL
jgi:hypothetical protein